MSTVSLSASAPLDRGMLRRAVALCVVLVLCALAANYMRPIPLEATKTDLEAMIPKTFGDWRIDASVIPVLPSADVEANLNAVYDGVLSRTYINGQGERMMLSLGYTAQQGGKAKPHWQEICYRAQGFAVSGLSQVSATIAGRTVPVSRFVGSQRNRVEPVSYWLTLGDLVLTDRVDRFMHLLRLSLHRQTTDGFLVRVSSLDKDALAAYAKQEQFMSTLFSALPEKDVIRLAGRDLK